MKDVYLDIDGPLIRDGKPTAHCFAFLQWAVESHRPHWLTTRDAHGQHAGILRAFQHAMGSPKLPSDIEALLTAVRPTRWSGSKTSGIDLASDFVWIDDAPLAVEIEALRGRGLLDRLIIVDSDDALLHAVDVIGKPALRFHRRHAVGGLPTAAAGHSGPRLFGHCSDTDRCAAGTVSFSASKSMKL